MRRVMELDALRGLAALSVLVYHLRPQVYDFGWPKVDLFLVLSGFLITTLVLDHGDAPGFLPVFYGRRALRIWPVYYLVLLALVLVNPFLSKPFPMAGLPYYLTFTQNVPYYWSNATPAFHMYFGHTWSLAIEEQFCLVWPWLICAAGRKRLVPMMLAMWAISVTARAEGYHPWLLLARCDGFALGGLLAALRTEPGWMQRHERGFRRTLAGLGFVSLAYLVTCTRVFPHQDFTTSATIGPGLRIAGGCVFYAAIVGLVLSYSGHPALGVLRLSWLRNLGRISYSMYIGHSVVYITILMIARHFGLSQTVSLEAVMLGATIGLATCSWHFFEKPIMRYRDQFRYVDTRSPLTHLDVRRRVPTVGPGLLPAGPAAPLPPGQGLYPLRGQEP